MSPVDRLISRLTSKSFVKFSMCSYERAVWLGYRDLGFSNRDEPKAKFVPVSGPARSTGLI